MTNQQEDLGALFDDLGVLAKTTVENAIVDLNYLLPMFAGNMTLDEIIETAENCWGTVL